MRFDSSKALYAYWDKLRGTRIAPRRFEIEPSMIADILPETFILEKIGAREFRFRLAGTKVCDRLGAQFRGVNFLSCWAKDDQSVFVRDLETVSDHGAVMVAQVEADYGGGVRAQFDFLILPLIHTGKTIDRFMGIVSCRSSGSYQGFGVRPVLKVKCTEVQWPVNWTGCAPETKVSGAPLFEPHVRHARIVRHDRRSFRVYEGGLSSQDKAEP